MRLDNLGSPRKPSVSGLRGERRGKGAGGVFAVLLAETEQRGLCPDDGPRPYCPYRRLTIRVYRRKGYSPSWASPQKESDISPAGSTRVTPARTSRSVRAARSPSGHSRPAVWSRPFCRRRTGSSSSRGRAFTRGLPNRSDSSSSRSVQAVRDQTAPSYTVRYSVLSWP